MKYAHKIERDKYKNQLCKIFDENPVERIMTVRDTVKMHSHHKLQHDYRVFKFFT